MTDRLAALLAESPAISRASRLAPPTLPVLEAFETLLPDAGLRPGSTLSVTGVGATSLALALCAKASQENWTAVVGLPSLGLRAASELGVDLDHVVVVHEHPLDALAAVIDAFDVVLTRPHRKAAKFNARIRERDAVVLSVGTWAESDLSITATSAQWHGIDEGHGHLAARTIDVTVTGRRAAAQPKRATLWLPGPDGSVSIQREARLRAIT